MYGCELCEHVSKTVSERANHFRWKHKRQELQRQCEKCERWFDPPNFISHVRVCGVTKPCAAVDCRRPTTNDVFCSSACSARTNNRAGKTGYSRYRERRGIKRKENYRDVCFKHWPEQCALCGWEIAVDVHHVDDDHSNDDPTNLVPLCQNHHMMTRLNEHKEKVRDQLKELIQRKFMPSYASGEAA